MPCTTHEGMTQDHMTAGKVERLTRISCDILRAMEAAGLDFSSLSPETLTWWGQHKAADAAREAVEAARNEREVARAAALAKLSPEDRKVLGL